jgi:hypothetical protein
VIKKLINCKRVDQMFGGWQEMPFKLPKGPLDPEISRLGHITQLPIQNVFTFRVPTLLYFIDINLFRGNSILSNGQLPRILNKLSLEVFSCDPQVVSTTCSFFPRRWRFFKRSLIWLQLSVHLLQLSPPFLQLSQRRLTNFLKHSTKF